MLASLEMEDGVADGEGEGEGKQPMPDGEKSSKRKMKTAYQLEVLEQSYAAEPYPSEALRAELSVKLKLTDRQLQMWFCHRRLKDRNNSTPGKRGKKDSGGGSGGGDAEGGEMGNSDYPHGRGRKAMSRLPLSLQPSAVGRMGMEMPLVTRYYDSPQSIKEQRVISFVESQLGEPLREDGPILGIEFDPLPPDAFGAPIAPLSTPPKQAGRSYDNKLYEGQVLPFLPTTEYLPGSSGVKRKTSRPHNSSGAVQEYQFLPEQPSVRSDSYERASASHLYESPSDPYYHGNDQVVMGYDYQTPASGVNVLPQHSRQGHFLPSVPADYEVLTHRNSFMCVGSNSPFSSHQLMSLDSAFMPSERPMLHEEEPSRMDRKRKSGETHIQKEVEAHEKRIRKEIEKQDVIRRKREEQMRREVERLDRGRRKDEERVLRERQREEERFQREQRREFEKEEKFLQKQSRRVEKMRLKEEQRREKKAARLKAANERATARRIARESMELIEDERLELLEVAASSKGLPSMLSIDDDSLQNLDSFKDMLPVFPPQSVQLKKPFEVKPWIDSEENVANLLMVWRFLITFTDVLELWPFTLDEFVQALHDYDPRLSGEIHISLLKSIIKDIADVARTPSVGLGASQSSAANPGGGHPQIVEGAYTWGFNIQTWQHHLNPATWPEVLRQLALSTGFGPKLKKKPVQQVYHRDDNEGHDGEDIISTLRNGSAAENAVALMQQKGYTHRHRSRHRLTPGTVKFAAFYVLSFEGERGLTILEAADKIQKSGLRDLTTSKTPEASIAAALSRDTLLFERTAPSTYCVRTPYRKDPADAEPILAAAREKVQIFQNRLSDLNETEKDPECPDDVDREEDLDGEGVEYPEVDDAVEGADLSEKLTEQMEASSEDERKKRFAKGSSSSFEGSNGANNAANGQALDAVGNFQDTNHIDFEGAEIDESNAGEPWVQGLMEGEYSDLTVEERLNALVALVGVAIEGNSIRVVLEERLEASNCLKKQMWAEVQLDKRRMKEEFIGRTPYLSYLKSEANAGVAEGGQSPLLGDDADISLTPLTKQEPVNDPTNVTMYNATMCGPDMLLDNAQVQQYGYIAAEKSRSQLKSYISHKAEEMYIYRSLPLGHDRRCNRYWQFVTSSKYDPGSGRIFFESQDGRWRLIDSVEGFEALLSSLDTRGIRESHLHSMLQRVETTFKETLKKKTGQFPHGKLIEVKGLRSSSIDHIFENDSPASVVCGVNTDVPEKSDSFKIEVGGDEKERSAALKRYFDTQKWHWKECFNPLALCAMKHGKKRCAELLGICSVCNTTYFCDDHHCCWCHQSFGESKFDLNFSEHLIHCEEERQKGVDRFNLLFVNSSTPTRIELLKAQLALIEATIPTKAIKPYWTEAYRKVWGSKLYKSMSAEIILQLFTQLEYAVNQDYVSTSYETTKELLGPSSQGFGADDTSPPLDKVPVLPWVPATTAAVALRLMEFDSSMSYMLQQRMDSEKDREAREFTKNSTRYGAGKSPQDIGASEDLRSVEYQRPYRWGDTVMGFDRFLSKGQGGRGRGRGRSRGRCQRQVARVSVGMKEKRGQNQVYSRRSRGRGRQKGRWTVRKRQSRFGSKSAGKVVGDTYFEKAVTSMQIDGQESPSNSGGGEEWEGGKLYVEGVENDNGGGVYDSNDNGQVSGDDGSEDDDHLAEDYTVSYNGRRDTLMNDSEEDVEDDGNGDEDDDGEGDEGPYDGGDGDEDEDGDDDRDEDEVNNVDDDIKGNELDDGEGNDDDIEGNEFDVGEGNLDEGEGAFSSSEYTDN